MLAMRLIALDLAAMRETIVQDVAIVGALLLVLALASLTKTPPA